MFLSPRTSLVRTYRLGGFLPPRRSARRRFVAPLRDDTRSPPAPQSDYTSSTTSWSPRCLRSKLDVVATRQQFPPLEKAWLRHSVKATRDFWGFDPLCSHLTFAFPSGGRGTVGANRQRWMRCCREAVCADTTNKLPYCVIPSEPIEASRVDLDERNKARGAV